MRITLHMTIRKDLSKELTIPEQELVKSIPCGGISNCKSSEVRMSTFITETERPV